MSTGGRSWVLKYHKKGHHVCQKRPLHPKRDLHKKTPCILVDLELPEIGTTHMSKQTYKSKNCKTPTDTFVNLSAEGRQRAVSCVAVCVAVTKGRQLPKHKHTYTPATHTDKGPSATHNRHDRYIQTDLYIQKKTYPQDH